jgi:hypothetical protein
MARLCEPNPHICTSNQPSNQTNAETGWPAAVRSACLQVDFPVDDPIEIIKRLIIGSEGTLGFVSQVTYNTVPAWPHQVRELAAGGGRAALK